jgi:putative acetyltransferase
MVETLRIIADDLTGVAIAALLHLLADVRNSGYTSVSPETGRPAPFLPARRPYAAHGFAERPPFGDCVVDDFTICMTQPL